MTTEKKIYTEEEVTAILQEKARMQVQADFNTNCLKELRIAITVLREKGYSDAKYLEALFVEIAKSQQVPAQAPKVEDEKKEDGEDED